MLRTLRNLLVQIIAIFIRDRDARHKFRNTYKRKSKFRKLRDDNKRIFNDIGHLIGEVTSLKSDLASIKAHYDQRLREWDLVNYNIFRVTPLDNSPPQGPDTNVFLAITCISKNEGPYLKEWIEYHKIVGVERFYFYDNESDDDTKDILEPYIKDGTVVYHFLPNNPITKLKNQDSAYNDSIFKYRDRTKWMAFIDIDEFIVPVEKNTIPEFLSDYEQYPGVVINWMCFDSNGHENKPTSNGGLVTSNYTRTRKDHNVNLDKVVKSIVNPRVVVYMSTHYGLFAGNAEAITEKYQKNRGGTTKFHSSKKIRINHYHTKSREEYAKKIERNSKGNIWTHVFNESLLNFPEETAADYTIQKYVPQLKHAIGITK